jgi:hypothetical protein
MLLTIGTPVYRTAYIANNIICSSSVNITTNNFVKFEKKTSIRENLESQLDFSQVVYIEKVKPFIKRSFKKLLNTAIKASQDFF